MFGFRKNKIKFVSKTRNTNSCDYFGILKIKEKNESIVLNVSRNEKSGLEIELKSKDQVDDFVHILETLTGSTVNNRFLSQKLFSKFNEAEK